jgi:hypothetical protein
MTTLRRVAFSSFVILAPFLDRRQHLPWKARWFRHSPLRERNRPKKVSKTIVPLAIIKD